MPLSDSRWDCSCFTSKERTPITSFTGLITTDSINQLFWDNANYLYAISAKSGSCSSLP
jgi:hypothetical protein